MSTQSTALGHPVRILRGMRSRTIAFAVLLVLSACSNTPEITPSPIPVNAQGGGGRGAALTTSTGLSENARGESIDRLLAVVEGKPLFLSTLSRRLGIEPSEARDPDNEIEIQRETMAWAKEQIFEKAADRIGLRLQAAKVDGFVEDRIKQELKKAEAEIGRPVTREEYLQTERLTWNEFREQQRGVLVRRLYMQKMLTGIGSGTRPQVDLAVSPAEVRRIYTDHREMFDEKAGVRLAQYRVGFDKFEQEGRDFLEVEELATRQANRIAAAFKRGDDPLSIAKSNGMQEEGLDYSIAKEEQWATKGPAPEITEWLLDPRRRRGDHKLIPLPTGIQILGILESRPERRVPFAEAYPIIVKELTFARTAQLEARTMIDLLSKSRSVWPESLADSLLEQGRDTLAKIQELDHLRGVRLR